MYKRIKVGTRPSPLALRQVEEIRQRLPRLSFEVIPIKTDGDKDRTRSLMLEEQSDFFTGAIEKELLKGKIDVAVHSAKDIEKDAPEELTIVAMTRSISPFECLVSRGNLRLAELPPGAIVGASSRRRKDAISRLRRDLVLKDIRGNVDDRVVQLDAGIFDAIVTSHAALLRLGYENRVAEIFSPGVIKPHRLQGRLAVQIRRDRNDLIGVFRGIHET